MVNYVHRHIISEINEALDSAKIVNLVGPRQAGKTTLVKNLLGRGHFVSLDDDNVRQGIENDAYGLLTSLLGGTKEYPVIIDEAQRSKNLPLALKRIVDNNPQKGQFLLTGSSNVFRTRIVTDSLAGRVQTVQLSPLTAAEIHGMPVPKIIDWALESSLDTGNLNFQEFSRTDVIDLIIKGGFPEIRNLSERSRGKRYLAQVNHVIDRDIPSIANIRKPDSFRRLVNQIAARTANELNISSLSRDLNMSRETIEYYLQLMRKLSLVIELDAWAAGEHRRDIKNPKYHFVDSGILCALRRFTDQSFEIGGSPTALGPVFESYVANEILRSLPFFDWTLRAYHWRSSNYREIDMIIERETALVGIEIKASTHLRDDVIDNLRWFCKQGPGRKRQFTGLIVYMGNQIIPLGDRIFAVPVSTLWS